MGKGEKEKMRIEERKRRHETKFWFCHNPEGGI